MVMSKKRYIILGSVVYLLALIMTLPANLISQQINSIDPRIQLSGINGSLWHGQIDLLFINNKALQDVEWRLQPLALLLGRLQLALIYADKENNIQLELAMGLGNSLQIRNLNGQIRPAFVQSFTPYAVPSLHGTMIFRDVEVILAANHPQQADGEIEWRGAIVELGQKISLGDVLLSLEKTEAGIKAVLSEQSGRVEGEASMLLSEDGHYNIDARFVPTSKGRHLDRHLGLLLRKGPDGSYSRTLKGQLR